MALPKAIERQVSDAEVLRDQVYGSQAEPTAVAQPVSVEPAPTDPVEPTNVATLPTTAEPAPPAPPAEDAEYWKKRFETVQGKLDAEMPRLFEQLRSQGETIRELTEKLERRDAPPAPTEPESLVTQKDIDAFGEDLIDAMRRTAQEEARKAYAAERAALEARFGKVETQVGQVSEKITQTSTNTFWGEVIKLVPEWVAIDKDPAWIQWLNTTPEYTDVTYRQLAGQAISAGKPEKIAKLVETWKKEMGDVDASPPASPPAPQRTQQSELERQVTPSTVHGTPPPVAGKIYTRAEYEALYDVRNVQRYGDKKAAEMIAEADLAVAENRVRWT